MTMSLCEGRYATSCAASVADGWSLDRRTPASRLFGANGLRTGPDGCIYIAQVTGSQISALDLGTGQLEISPDGALYFPVIGANEIWRIDLEGGEPQRVAQI